MGDLIEFAKRVKEQLDRTNHEPQWSGEEADRYMAEVKLRRQRYVELAAQLLSTVMQPLLEVITSFFPHSSPGHNDSSTSRSLSGVREV